MQTKILVSYKTETPHPVGWLVSKEREKIFYFLGFLVCKRQTKPLILKTINFCLKKRKYAIFSTKIKSSAFQNLRLVS